MAKVRNIDNMCLTRTTGSQSGQSIAIKVQNVYLRTFLRNALLALFFSKAFPGITDITVKKKIKNLTFPSCYVNKKTVTIENIMKRRFRCRF